MKEVERLSKYKGDIGIRVDFDIKADTHWDKKFDRFGFTERELLDLPKMKNLKLLHYHMGSQIKTAKEYFKAIEDAMSFILKFKKPSEFRHS